MPPETEDNSAIREMRLQIDAANKAATEAAAKAQEAETARLALETQLKDIERAKLDETERVKAEKADLLAEKTKLEGQLAEMEPIRNELGRFVAAAEATYTTELAAIPEALRPNIEKLSKMGTWPERLEALQTAKGLLPATTTITNPHRPTANQPDGPKLPNGEPDHRGSWDFKKPA